MTAVAGAWAGDVRVTIRLDGDAPASEALPLNDPKARKANEECGGGARYSQRLRVDAATRGLADAVVWLEGAPSTPVAQGPTVVLDQRGCSFEPHVLVAPAGGRVAIRNSDAVVHNIRVFRDIARVWEQWQQPQAPDVGFPLEEPGRYLVRCGVHPWMYAWVIVPDHPYFGVTGSTGEVIMPSVPEGTVTLRVWHETAGETQRRITVERDPTAVTIYLAPQTNSREAATYGAQRT